MSGGKEDSAAAMIKRVMVRLNNPHRHHAYGHCDAVNAEGRSVPPRDDSAVAWTLDGALDKERYDKEAARVTWDLVRLVAMRRHTADTEELNEDWGHAAVIGVLSEAWLIAIGEWE